MEPAVRLGSIFRAGTPGAVIWDMDGVLTQTMELHYKALRFMCHSNNIHFPPEVCELGAGRSDRDNIKTILSKNDLEFTDAWVMDLEREKNSKFIELIDSNSLTSAPGVLVWLEALQEKNILCAVASSSNMQVIVHVLHRLQIPHYFTVIISGTNLQNGKPHPEIFLRAALALGVTPSDCLVVEDSPHGIDAALRAGMHCLALGTTMPMQALSKSEIIVADLSSYPPEVAFG
jgi:beta-phosphoglucomutase family hydrolase